MKTNTSLNRIFRKKHLIAWFCCLALPALLASCGIGSPEDSGKIAGLTYTNSYLGFQITAPDSLWSVSKNVADPSAPGDTDMVVLLYYKDSGFSPNVVVTASPNTQGDSLQGVTESSINQFFSDSNYLNKVISYNPQVTINSRTFGEVTATFTKPSSGVLPADTLQVVQYVIIHNGWVLVFTFLDTAANFQNNQDFYTIEQSIKFSE